jgi:hypothetical protein
VPEYKAEDFSPRSSPGSSAKHYGILRKSGRYPWGSGGTNTVGGAARRARTFLEMVNELEAQGLSRSEIARGLGLGTTTKLRDAVTIANNAQRLEKQQTAEKLRDKGWSATAIGDHMGLNESSVRQLLNPQVQERTQILTNTINLLRDEVDSGGWLDVGIGSEYYIPGGGISKEKLRAAVAALKAEGYVQIDVQQAQAGMGPGKKTNIKVLCPEGTTYKDVVTSMEQIKTLTKVSPDGGRTLIGMDHPPLPISSDRIAVKYAEQGGDKADGVIYVRPGVEDVHIGGGQYAQVRILVDGTHYLKGMAMYKDDLPKGVDLQFNTNKSRKDPKIVEQGKMGALKPKAEEDGNPFGATIKRQITVKDANGKDRVTSVMNLIEEEGNWDGWSRTLSSQVLSKQSPKTAEKQLAITYAKRKQEFDEIINLTNPTVRAHLLEKFSETVDSDAVHLQAARLPRSSYHVLLPFNSLKDNEVYAPNFNQGERVALIRYPHGGKFEIPELTVNNNAPAPKAAIGRAKDAVGINHNVAKRLSGADFDGDFVMVVPNDRNAIKSAPALKSLENFDPQKYKLPDSVPKMSAKTKGKQMGDVSNLITDMTIQKASMDEIARAVKHSMVVIDAEKHHLDYKRSAQEHGIPALKTKYQGVHPSGQLKGASTLISRATSETRVLDRKPRKAEDGGPIDPATGRKMWEYTDKTRTEYRTLKSGEVRTKQVKVTKPSVKLAETHDARTLMSKDGTGTLIERVYADHSNRLKALANTTRKELVNNTDPIPTASRSAKRVYKDDVDQLRTDLHIAKMNSPRERAAQLLTSQIVAQKKAAEPDMTPENLKRVNSQALAAARTRTGAKKVQVPISDRQWEAIQAGAVSKTMLREILNNADIETVKKLATPKADLKMDSAKTARARSLAAQGLTQAEIARVLGVGLTTLKKGLA